MKLMVLGATGNVGRQVVDQALAVGHTVTAFVRRTDGLPTDAKGLTTLRGSVVTDRDTFTTAVAGHDAVISTLGNGLLLRNGRQPKIMAEAHQTIVAGARQTGTRRLVTMLAYGSGSTADSAPIGVRLLGATLLRADYTDLAVAEQTVVASDLAWTVCFFGALTNAPPRGSTLSTSLRRPPRYRISRSDLAAALVQTATQDAYVRQAVVVSGPTESRRA